MEKEKYEKSKNSLIKEITIAAILILAIGVIVSLCVYFTGCYQHVTNKFEITYSKDKTISFEKDFFLSSLGFGIFLIILDAVFYYLFSPSGNKPSLKENGKWIALFAILSLFGYLAFLVINILLSGWGLHPYITCFISAILVSIYEYLIYKLYLEKRTFSNHIFWELFRFAIVGLVAAVFDFITCFLFQFVIFKGNESGYVTIVSTIAGFIIGVIINYLMSTYMVYKNSKSSFSKSIMGIVFFIVLSAVGLGIGIGIQYLLYDFLYLKKEIMIFSYPVDFVIRTLVVMVYNYISRKLVIYR